MYIRGMEKESSKLEKLEIPILVVWIFVILPIIFSIF
jgi:hypothetical protein